MTDLDSDGPGDGALKAGRFAGSQRAATELRAIQDRYARRDRVPSPMYDPLAHHNVFFRQEWEREVARVLRVLSPRLGAVRDLTLLEMGCGSGSILAQLVLLGFDPAHLTGVELMAPRAEKARHRLPAATTIIDGDALTVDVGTSFDLCLQATLFSSILDPVFQDALAQRMWALVRPGGGIIWYDFTFDNPRNPDVRGIPPRRIREMFPDARPEMRRVTLAPPIARAAVRIHSAAYHLLNAFPFLRTHLLCWIPKAR